MTYLFLKLQACMLVENIILKFRAKNVSSKSLKSQHECQLILLIVLQVKDGKCHKKYYFETPHSTYDCNK